MTASIVDSREDTNESEIIAFLISPSIRVDIYGCEEIHRTLVVAASIDVRDKAVLKSAWNSKSTLEWKMHLNLPIN